MFICFVISKKCKKSFYTYGSFANVQDDDIVLIYIIYKTNALTNHIKILRSSKNKQ
jgi:hypothetical protein